MLVDNPSDTAPPPLPKSKLEKFSAMVAMEDVNNLETFEQALAWIHALAKDDRLAPSNSLLLRVAYLPEEIQDNCLRELNRSLVSSPPDSNGPHYKPWLQVVRSTSNAIRANELERRTTHPR